MTLELTENVPLAGYTTLGVGGPARTLAVAARKADLVEVVERSRAGERVVLLGGGSNVLVADEGVDALVVVVGTRGVRFEEDGDRVLVTAAAGEPWDELVAACTQRGLAGIECLSGIPGLVGATPIQNVGAYGQEVSDTLVRVHVCDRETGEVGELSAAECELRYRDSAFKSKWPDRFVILDVTFALRAGAPASTGYRELDAALAGLPAPPTVADVRSTVLALRRKKGMVLDDADPDTRSAGSFFTNPILDESALMSLHSVIDTTNVLGPSETIPTFAADGGKTKVAAAWLIERAGYRKGFTIGRAAISSKHALALTNRGDATADEIVTLARAIQDGVKSRFGVRLVPEPMRLGFARDPLA